MTRGNADARSGRRAIASETVAILKSGCYTSADFTENVLSARLAQSTAGTSSIAPNATLEKPAMAERTRHTMVDVVDDDTLSAAIRLADEFGCSVVALNFASAKHPGGGWLNGAQAQEESVTRRSTLYASLTSEGAADFYATMQEGMRVANDGLYTHAMIYSPAVDIIRDATPAEALLSRPVGTNFITAAAVNAGHARKSGVDEGTIRQTLAARAGAVLALAARKGHDGLVLGAWGCGVFRNDPEVVAAIFARLLATTYRGTFKHVAFALRHDQNRPAFERAVRQLVKTDAAIELASDGSMSGRAPAQPQLTPPPPPPQQQKEELHFAGTATETATEPRPDPPAVSSPAAAAAISSDGEAVMATGSWRRYPKIPESTARWTASAEANNADEYVVTEKLHGANFSIILGANGDAAFASRSGVLALNDNFYGFRSQGLDHYLATRARRLHSLCVSDGVCVGEDGIITIYGELCGGHYPHPAVAAVPGLGPVQRGCWYAPQLCFVAFDVRVHCKSGTRFMDFAAARTAATDAGFLFTRPLLQGPLSLCLHFPARFGTHLPATLGLPALEDDPNWAEGIVVRPAQEPAVWPAVCSSGDRRLVKIKIPEFSEKQYANDGWRASRNGRATAASSGCGMSWSDEVANLRYEMLAVTYLLAYLLAY